MKPIVPYQTRDKIMDYFEKAIFETQAIVSEILPEAGHYVSSEKQLHRCVTAIKGKFTQGLKPRKYSGIF